MKHLYQTEGVCASAIELEIDNGRIIDVKFFGGCNGNTNGISMLVKGERPEDIIEKLQGISCGTRKTSCPDQLAKALKEYMEQK